MCKFPVFIKRIFLFAVIFVLFAGNICFSEEITLTTVISNPRPARIVRGTITSSGTDNIIIGDGFTAVEQNLPGKGGEYLITFVPAFPISSLPTVVCTYKPIPGAQTGPKAQVVSVTNTNAIIAVVTVVSPIERKSTGAVEFIAIGPRP